MKISNLAFGTLFVLVILSTSCTDSIDRTVTHYTAEEYAILSEKLNLPGELYNYGKDQLTLSIEGNRLDTDVFEEHTAEQNHLATLGRVLFFDTQLSANNKVSCGSCHQQHLAFADDVRLSVGFDGDLSLRNSLPLGNTVGFDVAYGGGSFNGEDFVGDLGLTAFFGWDESNTDIQSQSRAAITSTLEMGMHDVDQVIEKIKDDPAYEILFAKAFGGSSSMNSDQMLDALDMFVNSISSNNSQFDKAMASSNEEGIIDVFTDFDAFTDKENRGKQLYIQNCGTCHSVNHSFTAVARANNGLDINYEDDGVGAHTGLQWDKGVFKVPFLRNIELTAPYMHDGRFETLEEVIDFYSEGIQLHDNLHPALRSDSGGQKRFNFSSQEKEDLIAYLHTLTDEELISEPKWSNPFK